MKISTLKKYIDILNNVKASGLTLSAYCKQMGISYNNITQTIYNLRKQHEEESEMVSELLSLYNEVVNKQPSTPASIEEIDSENHVSVSYERDENGRIVSYRYKIYKKNKPALDGTLTREEMSKIMRLYTYYGDGLTAKIVSRDFPQFSLQDLKRIFKAFSIYKDNCPFAPHDVEEKSIEELREIQLREKENSFLRQAEEDQIKNNEKLLKKYAQENIELKEQVTQRKELLEYLLSHNININSEIVNNSGPENTDIIIVLSDLHIGAFNEKFGYIKLEEYTENEINRRLNKIVNSLWGEYDSITVLNLGDSVDSYDRQTTRGGHDLPSVISNKEQSLLYQKIMTGFFAKLVGFSKKINYICVGESNHDGDWGWINNIVLSHTIKEKFNINSYISNNPIDSFNIQDCSFVYLHGKDNKNQFKNFPLTINDKTETWFNNYFLDSDKKFNSKKYILKGDLHQYAYTRAKHFDYISAPSLYGSSNWITANFGKTPWGALLIEINNNNIRTELIND